MFILHFFKNSINIIMALYIYVEFGTRVLRLSTRNKSYLYNNMQVEIRRYMYINKINII